jgi:hypothetical protein
MAVTSAATGCDDCWHHFQEMAAWSELGSPQLEAHDLEDRDTAHFCACSCSSLMSETVYSAEQLYPLIYQQHSPQPQLSPASLLPPFLPPRV